MSTWVLVAGASLIPALVMWSVADQARHRARAWWFLALGVLVAVALVPVEPWLSVLAVALLVWWVQEPNILAGQRGRSALFPVIGSWLAVAGTWFLVRAIPEWDLPWVVLAWGAMGWATAGWMVVEYRRRAETRRSPKGGFGQRMYAGCFFALLCCLLPVWAWPGLLVGLFLSGPSWLACLALVAGSCVRWPWVFPWAGSLILGAAALFVMARNGQVWGFKWLPRGDSLDSLRQRVTIVRMAVKDLVRAPRAWLIGFGPGTAGHATQRWDNQLEGRPGRVEALGNLHCEPLQVVYEFGALGLLGLGLFGWRVGAGLAWGDPWSAAAVAGGVVALGSNLSGVIPLALACLVVWARVAP